MWVFWLWLFVKYTDILYLVCIGKISWLIGQDVYGLSNKLMKQIWNVIITPQTFFYQFCFTQCGSFPDCLRYSKVIPIFKISEKNFPENYRLITIVHIFGKTKEEKLSLYFINNKFLCKNLFGFRQKMSTSMAIKSIVDFILIAFKIIALT